MSKVVIEVLEAAIAKREKRRQALMKKINANHLSPMVQCCIDIRKVPVDGSGDASKAIQVIDDRYKQLERLSKMQRKYTSQWEKQERELMCEIIDLGNALSLHRIRSGKY